MSTQKLTKKQKKGLAFRERKSKKQNGTLLEDSAIPEADPPVEEVEQVVQQSQPLALTEQGKSEIKSKKRKREADGNSGDVAGEDAKTEGKIGTTDSASISKRKNKKRKVTEESNSKTSSTTPGKTRFILFIGNLKYTTPLEAIQEHFAKCDPPPQVRLLTPKSKSPTAAISKSKGCAFLEFSHRNALQQGLQLHGSTLDGRRVNVELTAGGGGKSESRVQKVQARNKQLIEERKTRVQKKVESGGDADTDLIAPPQRHSTTSGLEEMPKKKRTWTVPEEGEINGRGGVKKRGKKGKAAAKHWGTGANAVAVG
ncbi:hypothetical protein K439DRAFT_1663427 [Ramaria rubella]|nr:hypothetical protein K439DRAFT_1663427 [Ramaria rubella]